MRIEEASKLMGIPARLISEIIDEHDIKVDRYLNGNHDMSFDAMMRVYSVFKGSYKAEIDYRANAKRLAQKVRRLESKIEKLKSAQPKPKSRRGITADSLFNRSKKNWYPHNWYPRKKRRNEVTV